MFAKYIKYIQELIKLVNVSKQSGNRRFTKLMTLETDDFSGSLKSATFKPDEKRLLGKTEVTNAIIWNINPF